MTLFMMMWMLFVPGEESAEKDVSGPEATVQQQIDAYNKHDLRAFLDTYADDVKAYDFPPSGVRSKDKLKEGHQTLFKSNPEIKRELIKRIVTGDTVIDYEKYVNVKGASAPIMATTIYRIENGKIKELWFMREKPYVSPQKK